MRSVKQQQAVEVDGPAVVTPMHTLCRPATDDNGRAITGKQAFRHETQFERACRLGQLVDKAKCQGDEATKIEIERALDRKEAGDMFLSKWLTRVGGTKDSLDESRLAHCSVAPGGASGAQIDAGRFLEWTRLAMGSNDWQLVLRVIWHNCSISEAVTAISPSYRESTLARFREGADSLIAGLREAHKKERERRRERPADEK